MIRRVLAHLWVVALTLVIGAVVTAQVVRVRKPLYKSETVIIFREGIARNVTGPSDSMENMRGLGGKLKELLTSNVNLKRLIDEFHLYPEIVQRSGYADAVDQMRKRTEFKARTLDTFAIAFEGTDRDQAQKVVTRMAELLMAANAERMAEDTKSTTTFLVAEKKRADEDLDRLERDISKFLQEHPEFSTGKEGLGSETQALRHKEEDERKARLAAAAARGKGFFRRREGAGPAAPALGPVDRVPAVDPVLLAAKNQAQTEMFAAQKDLADKSLRFTDQHPDVLAARERVAAAQAALAQANAAIAAAAPREEPLRKPAPPVDDPYGEPPAKPVVAAAPVDLDREEREVPKPKADEATQGAEVVSLEVQWSRLTRALTLARSHQSDLEQKLYHAEMIASTAESGYGNSLAVLDPAFRPGGPSNAPPRTVISLGLAVSIAIGLFLSAAWGLFLDDRLFAASEVEVSVMVPVLGVVPRSRRKAKGRRASRDERGHARA